MVRSDGKQVCDVLEAKEAQTWQWRSPASAVAQARWGPKMFSGWGTESVSHDLQERCWERTFLHCWWACKLVQPLSMEDSVDVLKKLKIESPYDPSIPLLDIYLEKTVIQKDTCTTMFNAALFTIVKPWRQPKCPLTDEWIKMWYVCTVEYYLAKERM